MVDFSGLLVSIGTWLFAFAEKQANMTSTNSFINLADPAIGKEIDLEAEIFQAISWNMSSTMNSTSSHSTSSDTPHYHQFIQAHTPPLSPRPTPRRILGTQTFRVAGICILPTQTFRVAGVCILPTHTFGAMLKQN